MRKYSHSYWLLMFCTTNGHGEVANFREFLGKKHNIWWTPLSLYIYVCILYLSLFPTFSIYICLFIPLAHKYMLTVPFLSPSLYLSISFFLSISLRHTHTHLCTQCATRSCRCWCPAAPASPEVCQPLPDVHPHASPPTTEGDLRKPFRLNKHFYGTIKYMHVERRLQSQDES